jgi:transcriptional regulator GlxA family with amidase domain
MRIVPEYRFDYGSEPAIVVVPAQGGRSPKMLQWIRERSAKSQLVMSVCTGVFVLGDAGLLKEKKATTHHLYCEESQTAFPEVLVQQNRRFVESDSVIFTAGGFSSRIDLGLHIVNCLAESASRNRRQNYWSTKVRAGRTIEGC